MADFEIPKVLRYSEHDEWAQAEDGRVRVGVTDYAQQQLGDIVFVELPKVGAQLNAGEPFGVVESVKAVADLFAPISGKVVEVNDALAEQPEALNEDCYGDGFLLVLAPSEPEQMKTLLDARAYARHIEQRS